VEAPELGEWSPVKPHTRTQAAADQERELRLVIGRLEDFASTVRDTLDQVAWDTKRTIIRTLIKRVEIDLDEIRVIFRIGPDPSGPDGSSAVLPDYGRGVEAKSWWRRRNSNLRPRAYEFPDAGFALVLGYSPATDFWLLQAKNRGTRLATIESEWSRTVANSRSESRLAEIP